MSRLLLIVAAVALLAGPARAQAGGATVRDAWARATAGQSTVGSVYGTISSPDDDRLTDISSPVAAEASLHQDIETNGVMRMIPVPYLDIRAWRDIALKPGGYHVMLTGLTQKLVAGQSFPVDFVFAKTGAVHVIVRVEAAGAMGPANV